MSWIIRINNFFHGAAVKVSALFVELFGKEQAEAFGHDALVLLKSDLGKITMSVVAEVAAVYTGKEARNVAMGAVMEAAKLAGVEAKESIVNLLIELAINSLKGHFLPA